MYHLGKEQLRICGKFCRNSHNKELLKKSRFIILQHFLEDTLEFIENLNNTGAEIYSLLPKPYSINKIRLPDL